MGRHERPICSTGPRADFARDLRAARNQAGIFSYLQMAERALYHKTTLSRAASGVTFPTWEVAWAYLKACGIDESQKQLWADKWLAAQRASGEAEHAST